MKVKITKCSNPVYWYVKDVGETFDVEDEKVGGYYVCKSDRKLIPTNDCAIVIEIETSKEIYDIFKNTVCGPVSFNIATPCKDDNEITFALNYITQIDKTCLVCDLIQYDIQTYLDVTFRLTVPVSRAYLVDQIIYSYLSEGKSLDSEFFDALHCYTRITRLS